MGSEAPHGLPSLPNRTQGSDFYNTGSKSCPETLGAREIVWQVGGLALHLAVPISISSTTTPMVSRTPPGVIAEC